MTTLTLSQQAFLKAQTLIPGGVNSPVRAYSNVGTHPRFITKGKGAYLWDLDNNSYIDFVCSWGANILGHAHQEVITALQQTISQGLGFGAPCVWENKLAQLIIDALPSIERVRLVSSGTEACMSAVRIARGFSGKDYIIKFSGGYHGHSDSLLAQAGSGVATHGVPSSCGVPQDSVKHTLVAEFNNLASVEQFFEHYKGQVAAIMVEPMQGNCGFIPATKEFLVGLRQLCDHHRAVLIFDEVMTGFRVSWQGAQGLYDVRPDLTTLGKVVGGGLPLAAVGGSKEVMSCLAPQGPVYQAGTLSGNPVAACCGVTTLELIAKDVRNFYERLGRRSLQMTKIMKDCAQACDIPLVCESRGGMFGFFFTSDKINSFKDAKKYVDHDRFAQFFCLSLTQGLYFAPSAFESCFISDSHDEQVMSIVEEKLAIIFKAL